MDWITERLEGASRPPRLPLQLLRADRAQAADVAPRHARARGRRAAAPPGLRRPLRRRAPGDAHRHRVATGSRRSSRSIGFERDAELAGRSARCAAGRPTSTTATAPSSTAIAAYNDDDCRSTLALRDWLLERRAEAERASASAIDQLGARAAEAAERQGAARTSPGSSGLRPRADGGPARRRDAGRPRPARAPAPFDLLGYHRREAKPAWWEYFARLDEVARAAARRGLRGDRRPDPVARRGRRGRDALVRVHAALPRAGAQARARATRVDPRPRRRDDPRARRGRPDRCACERAKTAGERAAARADPRRPVPTDAQEDALFRFAERVAGRRHRAVRPARRRRRPARCAAPPRLRPGAPPLADGPVDIDVLASRSAVSTTRRSFVQGPPGLRQDVDRRAARRRPHARRAARRRRRRPRTRRSSTCSREIDDGGRRGSARLPRLEEDAATTRSTHYDERPRSRQPTPPRRRATTGVQLHRRHGVAVGARGDARQPSTCCSSTRPGQMSLADAIAVSQGAAQRRAARRPAAARARQPGHAPARLGRLGARAPARRPRHRAAGPRACSSTARGGCTRTSARFVSQTMYDGRLEPIAGTRAPARRLGRACPAPGCGCSRSSTPSNRQTRARGGATRSRAEVDDLLAAAGGPTATASSRDLTLDDILVVAPYNAQVRCLRAAPARRRARRHRRQVPGPAGAGRVLLDDELERRGRAPRHGLPLQPQPPQRRGLARAGARRGRVLAAS